MDWFRGFEILIKNKLQSAYKKMGSRREPAKQIAVEALRDASLFKAIFCQNPDSAHFFCISDIF